MNSKLSMAVVAVAATMLSACWVDHLGDGGKNPAANQPDPPAAVNHAPSITGSPPPTIVAGNSYEFTPTAVDADGDTLEFSVARKPGWASFDRTTGRLWGTPVAADVGSFTNISIIVSDGQASAGISNFNITVDAIGLGQATLAWQPPTQNDDGTPLTDLAGYKIYYGRNQGSLTRVVEVNNPGLTRYVIENLSPALWFFAMTSVNSQGVESNRSPIVSKTVT